MRLRAALSLTTVLALTPPVLADERPDHFTGLPSPTLEAALANLSEYNDRLEAILDQEILTPQDLLQIHQITYTLENALEKLGDEQARLTELLEEVHVASESVDENTVRTSGRAYLEGMAPLTR